MVVSIPIRVTWYKTNSDAVGPIIYICFELICNLVNAENRNLQGLADAKYEACHINLSRMP